MSDAALALDAVQTDAAVAASDAAAVTSATAVPDKVTRRAAGAMPVGLRFAGAPRWMVVFADLTALLIAFFVLILSMSSFEPDAIARLTGVPVQATGDGTSPDDASGRPLVPVTAAAEGAGARYLGGLLVQQLSALEPDADVTLRVGDTGVVVLVPEDMLTGMTGYGDTGVVLERVARAAAGRVTLLASSALGQADRLEAAMAALPRIGGGTGIGFAGWLAPGQAAIAIAEEPAGGRS